MSKFSASTNERERESPRKNSVPSRYVTVPDAAKYLATTVWAMRQLISARKVPFGKIGKRFVLDIHDLDAFFAANKVGAAV